MDNAKIYRMELMHLAASCFVQAEYGYCYEKTRRAMVAKGFLKLGNGNYGTAFEHGDLPDYVFKLCGRVDGDSYPAWAYYCIANPALGLPEFEFPTFSPDRGLFLVLMPKYISITYDSDFVLPASAAEDYADIFYIMECGGLKTRRRWNGQTDAPWEPRNTPVVQEAVKAYMFLDDLVQWDLHKGNVMWDPRHGTLVITDPIHQGQNERIIAEVQGKSYVPFHELRQSALPLVGGLGKPDRAAVQRRPGKVVGRLELPRLEDIMFDELCEPDPRFKFQMPADFAALEQRLVGQKFRVDVHNDMIQRIGQIQAGAPQIQQTPRMQMWEWPEVAGDIEVAKFFEPLSNQECNRIRDFVLAHPDRIDNGVTTQRDIPLRACVNLNEPVRGEVQHIHVPAPICRWILANAKVQAANEARKGWGNQLKRHEIPRF